MRANITLAVLLLSLTGPARLCAAPLADCQAALERSQRSEAILACKQAVQSDPSPPVLRAAVAALMSGKPAPSELADAYFYARRAVELAPRAPWGYAAQCQIALTIGDSALARECLDALLDVAPEHAETQALLARTGVRWARVRTGLAWLVLLGLCVVTLARRLSSRAARPVPLS